MANITIPRDVAEKLYDLYNNVASADSHYQRCQSDNFRLHVKSVYQNKGVADAFAALKGKLESADSTADAPSGAETRRRGVLSRD